MKKTISLAMAAALAVSGVQQTENQLKHGGKKKFPNGTKNILRFR